MKTKRKIEIRIPDNLETNYTIVIPKGGNAGKGGQPAGDLVVGLKVK